MTSGSAPWLALDRAGGDLEGQVHRAMRERVLDGQLTPGQRLPSTRTLAAALGVARATVVQAYERLRAEGFIEARAGSATRVAALPASPTPRPAPRIAVTIALGPERVGLLQPGIPDPQDFPHAVWARCLAARARSLRIHDLGYGEAPGLEVLRHAILGHVSATRGVSASAEQVVVLPSTRSAIDLMARLVLKPGRDVAWVEEPGYPAAQALLRQAGARLVPVPCDEAGLDVARAVGPPPRLIYVTPSHQYPTGATMSLARRLAVLEAAQAAGAVVLEDDYDSEFQYSTAPLAALQGIDRDGSVAYLGTFAKVLAPGLRVAYAILPRPLVASARAAVTLRGLAVPIHIQAALADFLREGHLRAHVRRMSVVYAERMAATADTLRRRCGDTLEVGEAAGGLQLAARFRDPATDDRASACALAARGFGVRALSEFYLGSPRPGLLFGVAHATRETVEHAARTILAVTA